jgi:hypothetical protein
VAGKKTLMVATVVAFSILSMPFAATFALAETQTSPAGISVHTEDNGESEDGEDSHVNTSGKQSNDGDKDNDDRHGYIPPIFVAPGTDDSDTDRATQEPTSTTSPTTGTNGSADIGVPTATGNVTTTSVRPVGGKTQVSVGVDTSTPINSLGTVNPKEERAVDIERVHAASQSPAEEFLDAAYLGMGLLAASALGLGVTAGVRAVRLRRSGKSDYLYGDK